MPESRLTVFNNGILLSQGRGPILSSVGETGVRLDGRFTPLKWTSKSPQLRRPQGRAICLVPDLNPVAGWDEGADGRAPTVWEADIIGRRRRLEDLTEEDLEDQSRVGRKVTAATLRSAATSIIRIERSEIYESESVLFIKSPSNSSRSGDRLALCMSYAKDGPSLAHMSSPDCITGGQAADIFGQVYGWTEDLLAKIGQEPMA